MFTNYAELQAEIADWAHRSDLSAKIPSFIALAEAKLSTLIRARQLETTINDTLTGSTYDLPSDYDGLKIFKVMSNPVSILELVPDHVLAKYNTQLVAGTPRYFSITNNTVEFSPLPDTTYNVQFTYYATLPGLSSTNTTNWVLQRFPYVYLYGALLEAGIYTRDSEMMNTYAAKFDGAVQDIWTKFNDQTFSGSPLTSRSDYVVDYFV